MIRLIISVLLAMFLHVTAQAAAVEELSKSVVLLRQQQATEIKDGKQVEVWYRDTASNKFEPKLGGPAGTGFIIRYHGNDYLVTAGHIAKSLTLPSAEVIINVAGGKSASFSFDWLSKQKETHGARWFNHPKADISIFPLVYSDPSIVDQKAIDETVFPKLQENIPLLTSAYILGFPKYQGVQEFLSPLAKKAQIASKVTSVNDPGIPPGLKYIFLDEALAQGYSGAPVFYFEEPSTEKNAAGKTVLINGGLRLLGIQSSDLRDDTGGKLSLVVPIQYLWDILESDDFIRYEKSRETYKL